MAALIYILGIATLLFPLIIFLDYHKKHNVYYGIIYLVFFALTVRFVLPWLTATPERGMYFAFSVPLLMILFLFIAKKKKDQKRNIKKDNDERVIDNL